MKFNLIRYTENIYANYWLIPASIAIAALIIVFGIYEAQGLFVDSTFFSIKYSQSVSILSIIAGTTATMLSVVLSITILVLSIASNQLGPRLLPIFMKQGRTQIIIGLMLGTFVYVITSMYLLSQFTINQDTMGILCSIAVVLGIISFFLIIYFIHYVCHVIQIDNVLVYLGNDISSSIERNLTSLSTKQEPVNTDIDALLSSKISTAIPSNKSGYIQIINKTKLITIAERHNVTVELLKRPGHYIFQSQEIIKVYHDKPIAASIRNELCACFIVGIRRSSIQDIEFAFEQLSEIAIRSLSPSMANPFTAINCFDRVNYALSFLNQYNEEQKYFFNAKDKIRLITNPQKFDGIISATLSRFRQQAQTDLSVSIYMLQGFNDLSKLPLQRKILDSLYRQAKAIIQGFEIETLGLYDKQSLAKAFSVLTKTYNNSK